MKSYSLLVFLGCFLGFFSLVTATSALNSSYFVKDHKSFEIEQDTRKEEKQDFSSFSFSTYDIPPPSICFKDNVFCHEKTIIKTNVEKEWEVISVPPVWSKNLTSQQFSEFYPELDSNKIINNWSNASDKWITQRILYERGLLDVFPTGLIGFLTEEAIIKLQYYKNIKETDEEKGIVVIGPKTINELNNLKKRMGNENFIPRTPLPAISLKDMDPFHQKRLVEIDKALKRNKYEDPSGDNAPELVIVKPKNNGNLLQFSGEVKIINNSENKQN